MGPTSPNLTLSLADLFQPVEFGRLSYDSSYVTAAP